MRLDQISSAVPSTTGRITWQHPLPLFTLCFCCIAASFQLLLNLTPNGRLKPKSCQLKQYSLDSMTSQPKSEPKTTHLKSTWISFSRLVSCYSLQFFLGLPPSIFQMLIIYFISLFFWYSLFAHLPFYKVPRICFVQFSETDQTTCFWLSSASSPKPALWCVLCWRMPSLSTKTLSWKTWTKMVRVIKLKVSQNCARWNILTCWHDMKGMERLWLHFPQRCDEVTNTARALETIRTTNDFIAKIDQMQISINVWQYRKNAPDLAVSLF